MDSLKKHSDELVNENTNLMGHTITNKADELYYTYFPTIVETFAPRDNRKFSLSRQDIFQEEDVKTKFVKILVWGYPNAMGAWRKNMENILSDAEEIIRLLRSSEPDKLGKLLERKGIGLATATKLLYFFDILVEGYNPIIVDSVVRAALPRFSEFNGISTRDTQPNYIKILKAVKKACEDLKKDNVKISPGAIELFLFKNERDNRKKQKKSPAKKNGNHMKPSNTEGIYHVEPIKKKIPNGGYAGYVESGGKSFQLYAGEKPSFSFSGLYFPEKAPAKLKAEYENHPDKKVVTNAIYIKFPKGAYAQAKQHMDSIAACINNGEFNNNTL